MKYTNLICPQCNKSFFVKTKVFNYRSKKQNKQFFCSKLCCLNAIRSKVITKNCKNCKQLFFGSTKRRDKLCCSIKCSKQYSQSFIDRDKISNSMKKYWMSVPRKPKQRKTYHNICTNCSKSFTSENKPKRTCCKQCKITRMRVGSIKSVMNQKRRSKNEIYFADLCKSHFSNVLTNSAIFNNWDADIILTDFKIAILWNGSWHYKQIGKLRSLKQTQNRDKIKLDEIQKKGYKVYVIKDMGKYNSTFVETEFLKFKEWLYSTMASISSS